MDRNRIDSMGWERDLPDVRDLTAEAPEVERVRAKSETLKALKKGLPASVDLKKWCSPIEDQGPISPEPCGFHADRPPGSYGVRSES